MKSLTIMMSVVTNCAASQCAYNTQNTCHAKAVTIGDGENPSCDTYFDVPGAASSHARDAARTAGVGACKVDRCRHNEDYECMADTIVVGHQAQKFNCLTYMAR